MPTIFEGFFDHPIPEEIYRYTPNPKTADPDDKEIIVFLSNSPVSDGHVLVVPREPVDTWTAVDPRRWQQISNLGQVVARWIEHQLPGINRTGLLISGFEINHVHLHVMPNYGRGDMGRFYDPTWKSSPEQQALKAKMPQTRATLSFDSAEAKALKTQTDHYLEDLGAARPSPQFPASLQ